jgi:hypothetical protein
MKCLTLSVVAAMMLVACFGDGENGGPAGDTGPAEVTSDVAPDVAPDVAEDTAAGEADAGDADDSGPGFTLGKEAVISINAGQVEVTLTRGGAGDAPPTLISVNLSAFCSPETSPDCDLTDPANNEIVITPITSSERMIGTATSDRDEGRASM